MARVPVLVIVEDTATGLPIASATATIKNRATGSNVTLYNAESGGSTVTNPLTTNSAGRAFAWADRAALRIDYAGTGVTPWTEYRDIGPSSDRGIDSTLLPYGALPSYETSLPGSPVDGQEIIFAADATNGVMWHLRYRSGASGSYKWEFVGGGVLLAEVTTSQTTASTSYAALTTAGPSITVPLAGDYIVEIGCRTFSDGANQGGIMSYDIGGTGAVDADRIEFSMGTGVSSGNISRVRRKDGLAASNALVSKYKTTGANTATFHNRWMKVVPIRLG